MSEINFEWEDAAKRDISFDEMCRLWHAGAWPFSAPHGPEYIAWASRHWSEAEVHEHGEACRPRGCSCPLCVKSRNRWDSERGRKLKGIRYQIASATGLSPHDPGVAEAALIEMKLAGEVVK